MELPKLTELNYQSPLSPQILEGLHAENRRKNQAIDSTNYLADFQRANLASEFANSLLRQINEFNSKLDITHEAGIMLVSFGQSFTFHVTDLGYYDPSLIRFIGLTDDGNRVVLVQHVSQISFLLIALPRLQPDQPKRKIGFVQDNASY